ncbi:hypothetical protein KJ975_02115 [Myxococcota bacterium]|nr:hypothetical protein [Myxococcota bacterium]
MHWTLFVISKESKNPRNRIYQTMPVTQLTRKQRLIFTGISPAVFTPLLFHAFFFRAFFGWKKPVEKSVQNPFLGIERVQNYSIPP